MRRITREFQRIVRRFAPRGRGPAVLLYHRVAGLASDPQLLAVRPDRFREHLDVIRELTVPLSLKDLSAQVAAGTAPANALAVTFDDGYADNAHVAGPMLETAGVPATVFVATGWTDRTAEFWWDELERLLLTPGKLPKTLALDLEEEPHEFALCGHERWSEKDAARHAGYCVLEAADPTPRHALYRKLCDHFRRQRVDVRRHLLDQIRAAGGGGEAGRPTHRAMSSDEICRLAESGLIEIGAHTVGHCALSALSPAAQFVEIFSSKRRLESILGRAIDSFSYPFGTRSDYSAVTVEIVRDAGFARACANREGPLLHRDDPFQIPRYLVRDWDGETLAARLKEWLDVGESSLRRAG